MQPSISTTVTHAVSKDERPMAMSFLKLGRPLCKVTSPWCPYLQVQEGASARAHADDGWHIIELLSSSANCFTHAE